MMKHLEEHISESVAKKKTGKYSTVDPDEVRVGMKLKIKDDLSDYPLLKGGERKVGGMTVFKGMQKYLGDVVTVSSIELYDGREYLTVDENSYGWPIEIFEYV